MRWLCHIPAEFQVHLAFSFLYRCNNWGTYQQMIFQQFQMFKKNPFPLFLMDNIKLDEIPSKIKQKMWLFYIASQILQVLLKKVTWYSYQSFYFLMFYISKELHSPLSEKRFLTSFSFHGFAPTPMPQRIDSQNPQSVTIFLVDAY